jgi:hypothetical protein
VGNGGKIERRKSMDITEKELLAIKAVFYLARTNKRLQCGGYYMTNRHDATKNEEIPFGDAVEIVDNML